MVHLLCCLFYSSRFNSVASLSVLQLVAGLDRSCCSCSCCCCPGKSLPILFLITMIPLPTLFCYCPKCFAKSLQLSCIALGDEAHDSLNLLTWRCCTILVAYWFGSYGRECERSAVSDAHCGKAMSAKSIDNVPIDLSVERLADRFPFPAGDHSNCVIS